MAWIVELYSDFESEFAKMDEAVQDELLAMAGLLEIYGPYGAWHLHLILSEKP